MSASTKRSNVRPMPVRTIRARRLYEQIAEQIASLIRELRYNPGDRLPSELELAKQLGVSRPSVREAMIALETAGLIEVRTGDGTFVRRRPGVGLRLPWGIDGDPGPGPLEQIKARQVIEPELAAAAARRIGPAEIDALETLVDRVEEAVESGNLNDPTIVHLHGAFHVKLAQAADNPILAALVAELFEHRWHDMWELIREKVSTREALRKGVAMRRQLIVALRARDVRGARAVMRRHLARVSELYFGA